jgi:hypothetical protein
MCTYAHDTAYLKTTRNEAERKRMDNTGAFEIRKALDDY